MKTLEEIILKSSVKELEIALATITYNLSFKFQDGKFSDFVRALNPVAIRLINHRNTLVSDNLKIDENIPLGLVNSILGFNVNKNEMLKFKSTKLGEIIYNIIEGV